MVDITIRGVTHTYEKASRPAVERLDLEIRDGEFLVLVGPSGCGKSTTLRMLAGLELPDSGSIRFGHRDVTTVPGSGRDVAMVFQNYALYPHMTVEGNMTFALKNLRVPRAERQERVRDAAKILDIDQYLDRKPRELSGGQRQRVAMGRAIVRKPEVFLMDEPLSNLDAKLRVQTRAQISALQRRLGVTTVYVTHDQTEAMTMGDRVVVMNRGAIEQVGTPRELYDTPRSLFVAGFIGSPMMNLLEARIDDGCVRVGNLRLPVPDSFREANVEAGASLVAGFRPEDLRIAPAGSPGLELVATSIENLGSDTYVYCSHADSTKSDGLVADAPVAVRFDKSTPVAVGERITVTVDPWHVRWFDADSGLALGLEPSTAVVVA